jgi:hypothetical protein
VAKHLKTQTKLSDGACSGAFGDARRVNLAEIFIESSPNGYIILRHGYCLRCCRRHRRGGLRIADIPVKFNINKNFQRIDDKRKKRIRVVDGK